MLTGPLLPSLTSAGLNTSTMCAEDANGNYQLAKKSKRSNLGRNGAHSANPQLLRWDITISLNANKELTPEILARQFSDLALKWVFQQEAGIEGAYAHFQCRLELKTKKRASEIQSFLAPVVISRAAISPTSNAASSKSNSFSYVMKEDTRVLGPWSNLPVNPRFAAISKGYFPWQQSVLAMPYSQRSVHLVSDPTGNVGKTTFAEYLAFQLKEAIYLTDYYSSPLELMQFAFELSEEFKQAFFIIDLPRVRPCPNHLKMITSIIEKLANGIVQETRYKAKMKLLGFTKIVVFSNYDLDLQLSKDRIHKYTIFNTCLIPSGGGGAAAVTNAPPPPIFEEIDTWNNPDPFMGFM